MEHGTPSPNEMPQERVIDALRAMRARIRRLLVAERMAQAVTFGLAAALAAALLDWSVRLPSAIRCVELAALLVGGAWWSWTRVIPAWRFRPPLVEVALRVERAASGADRGRIASGLPLALQRRALFKQLLDELLKGCHLG